MNKTVTINIGGLVFYFNEDAYEAIQQYLAAIRRYVGQGEDVAEIMADIEGRIAELLQQALGQHRQAVTIDDVNDVRTVMGDPSAFGNEENGGTTSPEPQPTEKFKRKLFRDPDDQMIGGVCSGLAAYFEIDATWVRLAMVILVFVFGLSIGVYFLLWIIVPQARTSADRFAMRGEPSNIDTILRSFRDEAGEFRNRFSKNAGRQVARVTNTAFFLFRRLAGLFVIVVGAGLLMAFIASLVGITVVNSTEWVTKWKAALMDSPSHLSLAIVAFVLVVGVPIIMLVAAGYRLFSGRFNGSRWLSGVMGVLWICGLAIGGYVTVMTLQQFTEKCTLKVSEKRVAPDSLCIRLRPASHTLRQFEEHTASDEEELEITSGFLFREYQEHDQLLGFARLSVFESDDDSLMIVVQRSARGRTSQEANKNARAIAYHYTAGNADISLDQLFSVEGSLFRSQGIEVKIFIPKGKLVYFDRNVRHAVHDAENLQMVWPGQVAGRRWKMTGDGLTCLDCSDLEQSRTHERHRRKDKVVIDTKGIYVGDSNSSIEIDDQGVRVKER